MLKFITIAAGAMLLQASLVKAEEHPCKGKDEAACTASGACVWQAARIAGQTLTKKGEPHKQTMKAHCRKPPFGRVAPSKPGEKA